MTDCIAYMRVSTEQQAGEERTSLPEQRKAADAKAAQLGRVLSDAAIFTDPGVSGATAEGRPGFMAMLKFCESNVRPDGSGVVLVLNDSRFGRFDDPEESGYWRYTLKRMGWIVRFCEGDEMEDGIGRAFSRLAGASQSSEYRQEVRRRSLRASRATAEKGQWQTREPLGYRRLATGRDGSQRELAPRQRKAADERVRLTLGPESERVIVEFIFQEYSAGGVSLGKLARILQVRFPERRWSKQTVRGVLHNPVYVGDVVWGRRPNVPGVSTRGQMPTVDESKWLVIRDAHPALVSRELFTLVQARLNSNHRERRATSGGYPLTGLIRCASCGYHFAGGGGAKGPADDPDRFRFYRDAGGTRRIPACPPPMSTLRKSWLEGVVIDSIARFVSEPGIQAGIEREVKSALLAASGNGKSRRAELERERKQLVERTRRVVDAISAGTLLEAEATTTLAELRSRVSGVDAELERIRFADKLPKKFDDQCARLIKIAQDFPKQAKRLSGAALREVVKPWLADAVVDKEKRTLTLTLWKVPGAMNLLQLSRRPERDALYNRMAKRLTVRRRITIPPRPAQFIAALNRRRAKQLKEAR